jgi:hypothetical protein
VPERVGGLWCWEGGGLVESGEIGDGSSHDVPSFVSMVEYPLESEGL